MILQILVLVCVIAITWLFLPIKPLSKKLIKRRLVANNYFDSELKYQLLTLLLTLFTLGLVLLAAPTAFYKYFSYGHISAPITPVPMVGITPKENENWLHFGAGFALVISLVTFLFVYLNIIKSIQFKMPPISVFGWIVAVSLLNAFSEEMITRFSVIVLLDGIITLEYSYIVSAILFGSVHYFGTPGKITGVILATFLGWLLAKSIGETQGIFWAWSIHFLQDVIIITALYLQYSAKPAEISAQSDCC